MRRVGDQKLALERPALAGLVPDNYQVDRERRQYHGEAQRCHPWRFTAVEAANRALADLDDDQQQEDENARSGERLELAMAVRMIGVGRLARRAQADQADDVGR